jgi:hypothetical protein
VIAWYDFIKREMPDTFFVQGDPNYPLNFAATPYPYGTTGLVGYTLPMGNMVPAPLGDGFNNVFNQAGLGVYGASFPVAAGIYKNITAGGIKYLPQGYDGVDNDGDGLIDNLAEGVPNSNDQQTFRTALATTHTHNTARAEMLYALLVEGRGPLGSVFNADDFTDKEVMDTDGDGLPEFVDAWGNPLQFFRWPLLYHSDLQRGQVIQSGGSSWTLVAPYLAVFEQREQNPLDLNQQLVAPAWWSSGFNNSASSVLGTYPNPTSPGASGSVQAFEYYFHRLTEPYPTTGTQPQFFWDRGSTYAGRRAFYSKFLILSGGLDGQVGVFLYTDAVLNNLGPIKAAQALIANENNAMPFSPTDPTGTPVADFTSAAQYSTTTISYIQSSDPTNPSTGDLLQAAQDDISNQNIQTTVGIGGGG